MKSIKLLCLPALTLTLAIGIIPSKDKIVISTMDIYGPFSNEENCFFKFVNDGLDRTIHGELRGYTNNHFVFSRTFEIVDGVRPIQRCGM